MRGNHNYCESVRLYKLPGVEAGTISQPLTVRIEFLEGLCDLFFHCKPPQDVFLCIIIIVYVCVCFSNADKKNL